MHFQKYSSNPISNTKSMVCSQCLRTGLDPDSIRSVDPDPDMESGSGSGGTKNADFVYR